jgi:hypothetical protein
MSKKKLDPHARLILPLPSSSTPTALVNLCLQQVTSVLACADITNHPEVKAAANVVQTKAQTVSQSVTNLANARNTVSSLEQTRDQGVVELRTVHANLESLLNIASAGNAALVVAWGGKVASRANTQVSTDPPVTPTATATSTMGTVLVRCKPEYGAVCYLIQTGADPTHPEAWPAPVIASGSRRAFPNLTVGQKAYFRIAIVRRGGVQGQWSQVLEALVR